MTMHPARLPSLAWSARARPAVSPVAGESMRGAAYFAFALLGLIWGSTFIFMRWATAMISPSQVVLMRVAFGFLPLLIAALATRSLHWRDLRHTHHFLMMALLAIVFDYLAYAKSSVLLLSSVSGMLSATIPLFAFVMAWLFLREEPLNARSIGGTVLGFLGMLLIARPWSGDIGQISVPGALWMMGGSLSVGCSFVYARKFVSPLRLSPLALTTYQVGIALIILLLTTDEHGMTHIFANGRVTFCLIVGLGFCGTGLAYMLYYFIVDRLGAVAASSVSYIPPLVAMVIGVVCIGERIRPLDCVAMAAILVGVAVLQSGRNLRKIEVRPAV